MFYLLSSFSFSAIHSLTVAVRSTISPFFSASLNCFQRSRLIRSVTETRSVLEVPFGRPTRRCGMLSHAFRAARLKLVSSASLNLAVSPFSSRTIKAFPFIRSTNPRLRSDFTRILSPTMAFILEILFDTLFNCNNKIKRQSERPLRCLPFMLS